MTRVFLSALLLLAATVAATAQTVDRIKVLDFGVYTREVIGAEKMSGVAIGRINTSQNFKLVEKTDTIVLKKGPTFGVRYETLGKPRGSQVKLTWVMRFPEPGLVDPKGQRFFTNEFSRDHTIGNESFRAYSFDEQWEMVPGEWTFEFWDGPRKIGEKRFNVVKP